MSHLSYVLVKNNSGWWPSGACANPRRSSRFRLIYRYVGYRNIRANTLMFENVSVAGSLQLDV